MKFNLQCGSELLPGFVNIDSRAGVIKEIKDGYIFTIGSYNALDTIIKDSEAEGIRFAPAINSIRVGDLMPIVTHWYKKLAPKGFLETRFVDVDSIANSVVSNKLTDPYRLTHVLLGESKEFASLMNNETWNNFLTHLGFEVVSVVKTGLVTTMKAIKHVRK